MSEIYKEFTISEDKIYGYSVFDKKGCWCASFLTKDKCKEEIDVILEIDAILDSEYEQTEPDYNPSDNDPIDDNA